MINVHDILETIKMIDEEYLDVRTITMGISLLDCCDSDIDKSCEKIYNKITRLAKDLVKTGEDIEREYGIPIMHILWSAVHRRSALISSAVILPLFKRAVRQVTES